MTGWGITDASPGDAGPLALILGDWVRETGWMPVLHSREEDVGFLSGLIESHVVRVARGGTGPMGFLARKAGHIAALYLAPEARGLGVGKALLDEVKAVEPTVELWAFQANRGAVAFYLREGFREVERTDGRNDEGLPDLRLIWRKAP
ncbi:GNAT family N-acetyltransferase [Tabrizicola sp.]|uniref:GNAT family N-acetyltransferase n=1 Tax=Tabrizicola sp. TaxID=2005166 RepID=UPI003F413EB8